VSYKKSPFVSEGLYLCWSTLWSTFWNLVNSFFLNLFRAFLQNPHVSLLLAHSFAKYQHPFTWKKYLGLWHVNKSKYFD